MDLETKVDDLEKASEAANHENSILRAQVEKMSMELREYRKRLSTQGANNRSSSLNSSLPPYLAGRGNGPINNPNDVSFQFEFPKFGRLPGPNASVSPNKPTRTVSGGASPSKQPQMTTSPNLNQVVDQVSPRTQNMRSTTNGSNATLTQSPAQMGRTDMSGFTGLFSPSILDSVSKSSPFEFFATNTNGSGSSTDSADGRSGNQTSYSSPSASSNSNAGQSSSCGTSPEPSMQSPQNKLMESTLTTIGEERPTGFEGETTFCDKLNMACGNPNNPVPQTYSEPGVTSDFNSSSLFDLNGIDWLAQQNGNQFDPQLFGDYREPQDNILANDPFSETFFQDMVALPNDFTSPYNIAPSPVLVAKHDILAEIDQAKEADDEVVPGEDTSKLLTCTTMWYVSFAKVPNFYANSVCRDRLQACPKVKEGEFDLDLLCKDLQKKARCSETGAVVNESDFDKIMKSYVGEKNKLANKAANNV